MSGNATDSVSVTAVLFSPSLPQLHVQSYTSPQLNQFTSSAALTKNASTFVTSWAHLSRFSSNICYIGIDLDLSKPKGMPLDLKLHTYSFTTKYIKMAKA